MTILVTGGAGFIGSHLAESFIANGHQVVIIDNLYSGFKENIPLGATFYAIGIGDAELKTIFEKHRPEVVVHQAAQMDVRKSVADPTFDAKNNIVDSIFLLECCREFGVKKVLFASTGGAIYGEQDYFPADEEHPTRPLSPYGITKLSVEKYLFYYHQVHGLNSTILRYGNIYGPRQNPHGEAGVIAIFIKKLLAKEQPIINGDGTQTRDYTHVYDVVQANLKALSYPNFGIFNVGTGIETNVNEIFHIINSALGSPAKEVHGSAKQGEQLRSILDNSTIKKHLNWEPTIKLPSGLIETVEWFKLKT